MLEIIILSALGFLISVYAFYVERKLKDKSYKAACDISEKVSCSKAFSSYYWKLFLIPNSVIGIFFYLIFIILFYLNRIDILFFLSFLSLIFTIFLAYISYFKIKNFCLVCSAIYLINLLIFIFSYSEFRKFFGFL